MRRDGPPLPDPDGFVVVIALLSLIALLCLAGAVTFR